MGDQVSVLEDNDKHPQSSFFKTRRDFLLATAATFTPAPTVHATQEGVVSGASPLKECRIPRTDLVVSRIAYGNAMLGRDFNAPDFMDNVIRAMNVAYDNGITFFDTADTYGRGRSEAAFGRMLRHSPGLRKKIVIQSKCSLQYQDNYEIIDSSRKHIIPSVEGILRRIGTDYIDLLLLHRPDSLMQPEEIAAAFDELKQSGKVRYFGVSNYSPLQYELLQRYVRQPLVTNQIQLSLVHWNVIPHAEPHQFVRADEGVMTVEYCRLHDIKVQAYSPLRSSNTGIKNYPNFLSPGSDVTPAARRVIEMLGNLAQKHNAAPAAIMLAWLFRHPAEIIAVIGGSKEQHIVENCAATAVELTRAEWYSLLKLVTKVQSGENT